MKAEFQKYLESLGMGEVLIERVNKLYDSFSNFVIDEPLDILVSEYMTGDGQRRFERVFFFSTEFVYEVEDLSSSESKMWMAKLTGNIAFLELTPKDYNFRSASEASRLNLQASWFPGMTFVVEAKATGTNCDHIMHVVNEYLHPNLG